MLPFLLLAAGLALFALSKDDKGSSPSPSPGPGPGPSPGVPPQTGPVPPAPPLCPGLDKLPPEVRRWAEDLIRSGNASGLQQAVAVAYSMGLPDLAECLQDAADAAQGSGGGQIPSMPDTGYPTPSGLPYPIPGSEPDEGDDGGSFLDYCPEAASLPAPLLEQIDALLAVGGPAAKGQLALLAQSLQLTSPEVATCLAGLASQ